MPHQYLVPPYVPEGHAEKYTLGDSNLLLIAKRLQWLLSPLLCGIHLKLIAKRLQVDYSGYYHLCYVAYV